MWMQCKYIAPTMKFMRAGMTENRLTSVALMYIHYNHEVSPPFCWIAAKEITTKECTLQLKLVKIVLFLMSISNSLFFVIMQLYYYGLTQNASRLFSSEIWISMILWGICPYTSIIINIFTVWYNMHLAVICLGWFNVNPPKYKSAYGPIFVIFYFPQGKM